jgi:hypothetical protein
MAKMTKVTNGEALRGGEIVGTPVYGLPVVGQSFCMKGEPITEGAAARLVATSTVKEIRELGAGVYEFDTLNSTYRLVVD